MKPPDHLKCPACGAPFSAADMDLRENAVTCGNCGRAVLWSSLVPETESWEALPAPPRHLSVKTDGARVTLTYRHSRSKTLLFLGFAVVWGLFTLFLAWLCSGPGKTDFALPVFTTLFALTEVFLLFLSADMLLGKVVVRVEPGRAALFRGIGPAGSTWTFLLPGEADVNVERPGGEGDKYLRISVPQPSGRPFCFNGGISAPEALEYIVLVLRRFRA